MDRRPEVEVRFGRGIKEPLELEAALGHEDLAREQILEAAHDLVHRFPRRDVRDLRPDVISSFHVAVHFQVTTITKKVAGARRRRRALRAVEDRALLLAEVARLFEGNNSLVHEDFRRRFFVGSFHGLLGEGLGLAPPRVEGALAEHPALGVLGCPRALPSVFLPRAYHYAIVWLFSIAAGGRLPRGTAAGRWR